MSAAARWLNGLRTIGRPVFLAAPAVWDGMFVHWYFVRFIGHSPFGATGSGVDLRSYWMGPHRQRVVALPQGRHHARAGPHDCRTPTTPARTRPSWQRSLPMYGGCRRPRPSVPGRVCGTRRSRCRGRGPASGAPLAPDLLGALPATPARPGRAARTRRRRARGPGRPGCGGARRRSRLPRLVVLDVGPPVEVRVDRDQPALARVVEEDPAHRVGHREDPAPARPQHPVHLAHHARPSRRRTGSRRTRCRPGRRTRRRTAGPARRPAPAAPVPRLRSAARPGVPQHAGGQVHARPRRAPWVTSQRAAAAAPQPTSRTRPPGDVAEQPRVGLAQALRAPDEVHVAEEVAVLGLVVVGVGVPPAAGWPGGLGVGQPSTGHPGPSVVPTR